MGNRTKKWNEFRETGLLVFVNVFLQIFGWSLVIELSDKGKVESVYPKRVTYNGFPENTMTNAFLKIKNYIGIYEKEEVEYDDEVECESFEEEEFTREEKMFQASINNSQSKNIFDEIKRFREDNIVEEKSNGSKNRSRSRDR